MSMQWPRWRVLTAAAGLVGFVIGTLPAVPVASAADSEPVTLTVWTYGNVFEPSLVDAYRKAHPNVTIRITKMNLDDAHNKLLYALPSWAVPDIATVDMAYSGRFRQPMIASQFTDLNTLGAAKIAKNYLPFRWAQGTTLSAAQIGIPVDVGGLAAAYRPDLFQRAGLPSQRDAVARLWRTWGGFISTGTKFQRRLPAVAFMDTTDLVFPAALGQASRRYYDPVNLTPIYRSNPAVKSAFFNAANAECLAQSVTGCVRGLGAGVGAFTPEWGAALNSDLVAVVLAPHWLLDSIKQVAPSTKGKWDIAVAPGGGSGNVGGSMLTIPKKAANVDAAWAFLAWYTAAEQQLKAFEITHLLPTVSRLYSLPAVAGYKDSFFRDAPIGAIYSKSVVNLKPVYAGPNDRLIDSIFGQALSRLRNGTQDDSCGNATGQYIAAAWCQALDDIQRSIGQ